MPHTAYIIHQFTQFDVYKPSNHTIVGLLTWFEFSVTITFHCEMKLWLSCVITERRETFFFFLSGWSQCNFIQLFTVWNIVNEWMRNKQCAFWWNDEALLIESTYFLYVSAENRNWRFSSNNSEKNDSIHHFQIRLLKACWVEIPLETVAEMTSSIKCIAICKRLFMFPQSLLESHCRSFDNIHIRWLHKTFWNSTECDSFWLDCTDVYNFTVVYSVSLVITFWLKLFKYKSISILQ